MRWERPSPPGTGSWALPDLVLGHEVHALGRSGAERFLRHGGSGPRALVLTSPGLSVSRRQGDRLPSNVGRGGGGGAAPGAGWGRFLVPAARLCPPLSPSPSSLPTCLAPAAAVPSCAGNPGGTSIPNTPVPLKFGPTCEASTHTQVYRSEVCQAS